MKKIRWEKRNSVISAVIGGLTLRCCSRSTRSRKVRWFARAYITGNMSKSVRIGGDRHSLLKAQEDAIQFAHEILLDYKVSLDAELKNFDLLEQEA